MYNPFFTADLHLGHANAIKYCNRPFTSTHEMNASLIANWNAVINETDDVFLVGDVSFSGPDQTCNMLKSMHGKKFLVAGNHDARLRRRKEFADCFEWVKDYHELFVQDKDAPGGRQLIVLCHFPMLSWNHSNHGSWMVHGHCHGNLNNAATGMKRHDCGVDPNQYFPIRYTDLKRILSERVL
jgi:calcineurin-like phosphoesterase family protein